jgi:hypothetical protein
VLEALTRHVVLFALTVVSAAACATGSLVTATTSSSGGRDGGAAGGGKGTGGSAPTGDAIPQDAVSFFNGTVCPAGWAAYAPGAGFSLVPTTPDTAGGVPYGAPLASGEDRTHTHTLSATFVIGSTSYVGVAGGNNDGVAAQSSVTMATLSSPASTGLPYVQLMTCKKTDPPVPGPAPLPPHMQMFFDAVACPPGWIQPTTTQGRFLVGLPQGATADQTFGGQPVTSTTAPTHTHGNTATLVTTSHGIALAGGCCAGGYAAAGTYTAMQDTDPSAVGFPFLPLLSCEKQ